MVNPGGFSGLRREFLEEQQEAYNEAAEKGHAADTLADIQRRYFKRFPVSIPFTQEPTEAHLASVDDDAPDPEITPPSIDGLSAEAAAEAQRVYENQGKELKMCMAVCHLFDTRLSIRTDLRPFSANQT